MRRAVPPSLPVVQMSSKSFWRSKTFWGNFASIGAVLLANANGVLQDSGGSTIGAAELFQMAIITANAFSVYGRAKAETKLTL
jgi:hypothetical protein